MTATTYEVNAIVINPMGKPDRLFTQTPQLTLKECDQVVESWKRYYKLLISWVVARYANGSTRVVHLTEYDFWKNGG